MSVNGSIINNHCWLDAYTSQIEKYRFKKLEGYFESRKALTDFPIVIFSKHYPTNGELTMLLGNGQAYMKKGQPVILAIEKKVKEQVNPWALLDMGVDDIITWEDEDDIITYLESKHERNKTIGDILNAPLVKDNLVGDNIAWKKFLTEIIESALFSNASILLIGDSGTGKELLSRLIHTIDTRADKKKLIIVDCTTIVPELSGSELFGHERGSYTNAIQSREGAFALANNGTLFLDEIGELPLHLQAELLRVLQEGTYKKVGSNTWQKTSFRLVCATNKDLRKAVEGGRFRQDLYYRIADCEFAVPSLQERKDDIPALVQHFLSQIFSAKECPQVDKPVMDYLVQRAYPGNVRELKQLVGRIATKHVKHKRITIGEVPLKDRYHDATSNTVSQIDGIEEMIRRALLTGENWWDLKDKISETAIRVALELEDNNKEKAAERLGVNVRTVQQYVKKSTPKQPT